MEQISIVIKIKEGDGFGIAKDIRDYVTKKFQSNLIGKVGVYIKSIEKFEKNNHQRGGRPR